ncbi:glycosyltransferase [Pseudoduganella sp. OTU4001]|uniref:glycosyltransferase n=1 Tax=Pseudoduganella sp. OTU4001 TaxID=3043854 RepID=UPI00313EFB56
MRIVVDLQSCQNGAAHHRSGVLALAQALAGQAGHQVFIALNGRLADSIDELRHAFAGLVPAERIISYQTPAGDAPWQHHAAEQLRIGCLAALDADAVVVPGLLDHPQASAICGHIPQALNVVVLDAGASVQEAGSGNSQRDAIQKRNRHLLDSADMVVHASEDESAAALAERLLLDMADNRATQKLRRASELSTRRKRPRLAFVTPLPPEKSGIADYSAEVLAEIRQFYDIEVVATPGATPDAALAPFPVRSVEWFEEHASQYERIVYHFGNSNYHKHMFGLLQRHPGVVVLHDFYLSGVLDNMERDGDDKRAYMEALYASHGHTGVQHHSQFGRNPTIWGFPCNLPVLEHAAGVIVHSDFSKRLAEQWYGAGAADGWITLPLLRGQNIGQDPAQARQAARAALGLADDAYVVSTFGMLGRTKLNDRLLDAFLASPLAQDPRCLLVFVGENDPGDYGAALLEKIAASPAVDRIRITGFASAQDYAHWLAASDTAVQLRDRTRGETSASVLDCLLYGVPTIINAHGASADLPGEVLVKLEDKFDNAALSAALASLHADGARRDALAQAARDYIRREHSPAQVGKLYHEALEHFAEHGPRAQYERMLAGLAAKNAPRPPNDAALVQLAAMIAANRTVRGQRQLLVDISALVLADHKTGIQRVVRSILLALIKNPPAGFRIEPVFSEGGGFGYRYARRFAFGMLGGQAPELEDAPVELRAGDIFLGLDLATNTTSQNENALLEMRRRGVGIWFVVYDLLPLLRPDAFPYGTKKYYGDYVNSISLVADGIVAISRAVSDELAEYLAARPNRRTTPLQLGYFHLGADINASAPSTGMPDNAQQVLDAVAAAPTFLMVGTIEPRKGQLQALSAFEQLWADGVEANLVIVGKGGWLVDNLVKRLENNPHLNQRLFWLAGVSDEMLLKLYENCAALLAASEGEGFGLPLIEAAQHELPIIARGIPVFREVAGEHAYYFDGKEPQDLAQAVRAWIALDKEGKAPQSARMPWLTWQQSADQLVDVVVHGHAHAATAAGRVAPQLLVDVSATARDDLKTGIQRVVRAQLMQLMHVETTDYQVLPVYLTDEGGRWHYRYARRYEHTLLGTDSFGVVDEEVRVNAGDVFYSPDFFPGAVTEAARVGVYKRWRAAGVSVNFLVHDLLPVLRPDFFPPGTDKVFAAWLSAVADNADRLVCISAAVADETRAWLTAQAPRRALPEMAVVHHGADIDASQPSTGMPDDAPATLADIASAPSFLMVGTIEPRKGHMQALDAFEKLWSEGADVRLVIVGGEGWKGVPDENRRTIPAIMARLSAHPELGKRLHWLRGVSDEYLDAIYQASACLLVPSEGEGFGLPLIEAARHGKPIIARDIPVFREVAQEHAHYFNGSDGADLAQAMRGWLQLQAEGKAASSEGMPWQTWADNVRQLTDKLFIAA